MGLDNGVNIVRNDYTNRIRALKRFEASYDTEHKYNFSVCYWRKCWGLRGDILGLIGKGSSDEWEYPLTKYDIEKIIDLLKSYDSKSWTDSIWDWDDKEYPYSKKIKQDIKDLKTLKRLMKKYDLEVYFYDSY